MENSTITRKIAILFPVGSSSRTWNRTTHGGTVQPLNSTGFSQRPDKPETLLEPAWSLSFRKCATKQFKANRSGDDIGLVAEILRYIFDDLLEDLLVLYNGGLPHSWHVTRFMMLPGKAKVPNGFRPLGVIRLLYKTFAYVILLRVEHVLDNAQLKNNTLFAGDYRLEKHLVTLNLVVDKLFAVGTPIWLVSFDLSKAFDRVGWAQLWRAGAWCFRTLGLDSSDPLLAADVRCPS